MKVFLILLVQFFIFNSTCQAQHEKTNIFLSVRAGHLDIQNFGPRVYGGVELEFMVSQKIGIHYSFLIAEKYFHMPLAPVGGLITGMVFGSLSSESDSTKNGLGVGIVIGILTAIIPEGISYNIPITNKLYIAPYISPLQFEVIKANNETDAFAGGALGLRFHQYLKSNKFRFSPYFEYKIHYRKNTHPGFSTGLNFSMRLK